MRVVLVLLWCVAVPALAAPHFDIAVRLEPEQGRLLAQAKIGLPAGERVDLRLDARHRVVEWLLDGAPVTTVVRAGSRRIVLKPSGHAREMWLRWTIEADPPDRTATHRDTLSAFAPQIGEAGSFLPAGGAWYPLPHDARGLLPHRYTLAVDVPVAQRALAPGQRVSDTVRDGRRDMRFEMAVDSEGADLMAGPWIEAQRTVRARDGRTLTLRTLFHPDIASLAEGYLDATATHLARIEAQLGDYPYRTFTIASSPTPTGFGMAGLTYLGTGVLRLPFIRNTSLPHEILHNWWGNGVYLSSDSGNWAEGLTTFMADYAQAEAQGEDAARAMRLDWLRSLSALAPLSQDSLANFASRTHDASQVIGYYKSALVFLMLRDRIGTAAFDEALRTFWRTHRHRRAGWNDLRRAFEATSSHDLTRFFAQWVDGAGLAQPRIAGATRTAAGLSLTLAQPAPPYELELPLRVRTDAAARDERVSLHTLRRAYLLAADGDCVDVALDPDFRLARRLAPAEAPPILREATLDASLGLAVLAGDDAHLADVARGLAGDWLDAPPPEVTDASAPGRDARLVIGSFARVDGWLMQHGLPARTVDGDAVAWAQRGPAGGTLALVAARDADALAAARRALPHYGRQGWVTFQGARATARGQWPATTLWRHVCVPAVTVN
jgi:aminopeptidase N